MSKSKTFGLYLLFLFLSSLTFAQGTIRLGWNIEVGCLEADDIRPKDIDIFNIEQNDCIAVCKGSSVTYTLSGEGLGTTPITQWSVSGGTITSQNNTSCVINWNSNSTGNLSFTITTTTGLVITKTICINIKPGPIASFLVSPSNFDANHELSVCVGQTIQFINTSVSGNNVVSFDSLWSFGDNTPTSTELNPYHTYDVVGTYFVELLVTNSCSCKASVKQFKINVIVKGFNINTKSVVCEGQTESYTIDSQTLNCNSNPWSVQGGTLLSNDSNNANVRWDNVDATGFGVLSYNPSTCGVECPLTTEIRIPVVKKTGTIVGNTSTICTGDQASFSLPQWPTTEFRWKVLFNGTVNPSTVLLTYGDQRNEVFVRALSDAPGVPGFPGGQITLVCEYTNTLLNCGGSASYTITINRKIPFSGPQQLCTGTVGHYFTTTLEPVNWVVKNQAGVVQNIPNSTNVNAIDVSFLTAGNYTISLSGTNVCNNTISVSVSNPPTAPIISTTTSTNVYEAVFANVCPSPIAYTYKIQNPQPGVQYFWSVFDGSFVGSNVGTEVQVKFNASATQSISVYKKSNSPLCNSLVATKIINMRVINEANAGLNNVGFDSGPSAVCSSSLHTYHTPYQDADQYEWEIIPSSLGSIESGETTANPVIRWNNAQNPNGSIANLKLTVYKCSIAYAVIPKVITISNAPILNLTSNTDTVCSGNTINFTASSPFITPTTTITWEVDGIIVGTTTGTTVYSYLFNSSSSANSIRTVKASFTLTSGCIGTYSATKTITVTPGPGASLSMTGGNVYCLTSTPVIPITTVFTASSPSTGAGITYTWLKNGSTITGFGITPLTTSLPASTTSALGSGFYQVKVTNNSTGCSTISNGFYIVQDCPSLANCNMPTNPVTTFSNTYNCFTATNPNPTINFTGTATVVTPVSQSINIIGPVFNGTYPGNILTLPPTGSTTALAPGIYQAFYTTIYNNPSGGQCKLTKTTQRVVPYIPKFNTGIICGIPNYSITLTDASEFFSPVPNSSRTFKYYIKLASAASYPTTPNYTTANPATFTLVPGTYNIKLVIQGSYLGVTQPACETVRTIILDAIPTQQIIAKVNNIVSTNIACYNSVVNFSVTNPVPGDTYLWDFNDDVGGIPATNSTPVSVNRVFSNYTTHDVTLKITSKYGCVRNLSLTVTVPQKCFNGNPTSNPFSFNFNPSVCFGNAIQISYQAVTGDCTNNITYTLINEATPVATNTTGIFLVTNPGSYSLKLSKPGLVAGSICNYQTTGRIFPEFRLPPTLSLTSPGSLCFGTESAIGITTNATTTGCLLSYTLDGVAGDPLTYEDTSISLPATLAEGNHTIVVSATDASGCTTTATTTVTVVPAPNQVVIAPPVYVCSPTFGATLTASVPGGVTAPSTFLWSNGFSGTTITVNQGGAYLVKYINEAGCMTTAQVNVMAPPDQYLWEFPSGNYDICKTELGKLVGPFGSFSSWKWKKNNIDVSVGSGLVSPYTGAVATELTSGTYNLQLSSGGCPATSLPMIVNNLGTGCANCLISVTSSPAVLNSTTPFCSFNVTVNMTNTSGNPVLVKPKYSYNAVITPVSQNATSMTFTVIPLNSTTPPITYVGGSSMEIQFTGTSSNGTKCLTNHTLVNLPNCSAPVYKNGNVTTSGVKSFTIAPNPAKEFVAISFDTNVNPSIEVYDTTGKFIAKYEATTTKDSWNMPVSNLAKGIYIVVLKEEGQIMSQNKLIVE